MIVEWLFLAVPWGCLQFVIVVFPDYTHLLFFTLIYLSVEYLYQDVREFLWLTIWLNIKACSYSLDCDQFCLSVFVDQISC